MTIASAPSGIGAPVKMRTASPGPTAPSKARPAADSPITVRVAGADAVSAGAQRVAVHGGVGERRLGAQRLEVAGEHAAVSRFKRDLFLLERRLGGGEHARERLLDRDHCAHRRLSFGSFAARHSPDLPPRFSISRTPSMLMPRSIALAMS